MAKKNPKSPKTLVEMWQASVRRMQKHEDTNVRNRCVGYRKTLKRVMEKDDPNGKAFERFHLANEISWLSYKQYEELVENFAIGLTKFTEGKIDFEENKTRPSLEKDKV